MTTELALSCVAGRKRIRILKAVPAGHDIRPVGSDIGWVRQPARFIGLALLATPFQATLAYELLTAMAQFQLTPGILSCWLSTQISKLNVPLVLPTLALGCSPARL